MSTRTTETTVTFERHFKLITLEERQPPGTYRVVVEEEERLGVSFPAYRRSAPMPHIPGGLCTHWA